MDDVRTKQTLDALADLFLTGASPAPAARASAAVSPVLAAAARESDPLSGPRPIRLAPKLRPSAAVAEPAIAPRGVAEPLAKTPPLAPRQTLRLHRPDGAEKAGESASRASGGPPIELHLEAVMLGNLPGFGGPWLTQYAHHLAQRRGSVAVVHIDADQIELDLVTAGKPPMPQDIDDETLDAEQRLSRWATSATRRSVPELFDALINEAPARVETWLFHLPTPVTPEALAVARSIKRWTVVCGADEAAVGGAHRLIKSLLDSDPVPVSRKIGVMVMGADEARAYQVADRMRAALDRHLASPVELIGHQKQMVPVNLQTLGSALAAGNDPAAVWPTVWSFIEEHTDSEKPWLEEEADKPAPAAASPTDDTLDLGPADLVEDLDEGAIDDAPRFDPQRIVTPAEAEALQEAIDEEPIEEEVAPAKLPPKRRTETTVADLMARTRPKRRVEREIELGDAEVAGNAGEPDLSSFLSGGGVALAARCPRHRQTQLVLDEHGVLHLLRRHETNDQEDPGLALRAAVLDLIETRAWVREHAELIAMTQRQCRFDPDAEAVLHLFTGEAKLGAALVGRLGEFVRLHLLKEVRVGRQSTWFSTELN